MNGVKYMRLCNDNDFKKKSLYDNVYFTLRDIFVNAESYDDIMAANLYNDKISGGVYFEDRTDKFEYVNLLEQKDFLEKLKKWLKSIRKHDCFEFRESDEDEDAKKYMKLDDWWEQFEKLKQLIEEYEK